MPNCALNTSLLNVDTADLHHRYWANSNNKIRSAKPNEALFHTLATNEELNWLNARNQILTITMQPLGDSFRTIYVTQSNQVAKAIQLIRTGVFCSPSNILLIQPFTIPLAQPYAAIPQDQFPKNQTPGYRPHTVNKQISMVVALAISSLTGDTVIFDIWGLAGLPQVLADLLLDNNFAQAIWSLDNATCIEHSHGLVLDRPVNVGKITQQLYHSTTAVEKLALLNVIAMKDMNIELESAAFLLSPTSPKKTKTLIRHACGLRDLTALVLISTTGFAQLYLKNKIYKMAPAAFSDWVNTHKKLLTLFQSSAQYVHSNKNKSLTVHILQFMLHAKYYLMSKELNPITLLAWEGFRSRIMSDAPEPWQANQELHFADQDEFDHLMEKVNIRDSIDHKFWANGKFASTPSWNWDMEDGPLWGSFTTPDLLASPTFPEKKGIPCTNDEPLQPISSQLTSCLKLEKLMGSLRKSTWPPNQLDHWEEELVIEEIAEQLIDEDQLLREVEQIEKTHQNGDSNLSAAEILQASIGILNQSNAVLARVLTHNSNEIQQRTIAALTQRLDKRISEMQSAISKLHEKIDKDQSMNNTFESGPPQSNNSG